VWRRRAGRLARPFVFACILLNIGSGMLAQVQVAKPVESAESAPAENWVQLRAQRFLAGRIAVDGSAAEAMDEARVQHAALAAQQTVVLPRASVLSISPRLTSLDTAWQPVGPAQVLSAAYGKVTGRVTAIAIDATDTTGNTVYLGTTGGGVWKSTNAAGPVANVSFAPLTDTLPVFSPNAGSPATPSLSIGAVSVQGNVVLAGTGDPNDATDSFYGEGLLRSADGGLTWTLIRNSVDGANGNHRFTGLGVAGFAWSTASPATVVAAVSHATKGTLVGAVDAQNSVMGLYYSTDAGVTWQMSTVMDGGQIVQRPLLSGANHGGNAATAVAWNPVRKRFYAALRFHGYYESADGIRWARLAQQPGAGLTTGACPANTDNVGNSGCPIFRGALAVESIGGDTYALTVDASNKDQGLWRDVCANSGTGCASNVSFTQRVGGASLEVGAGNTAIAQGDYNLSLAAVTSGLDTLLFAGTVDLYRCSLSSGCTTLRNTTNALNGCGAPAKVAASQHALAALATTGQLLLYIGNDGGLWRSADGVNQQATPCSADDAAHFDNLNGGLGSLAEVVSMAQHPSDATTLLVGMGANGTAATTTSATGAWPQLSAGEGGGVAIDPANPTTWYVTTAAGVSIQRCANGSACAAADFTGTPTIGPAQTARDLSLINTPWLLDPLLSTNVILGTCRVWRGPGVDGALWSSANAISRMLAGSQSSACTTTNPVLRSLGAGGPASNATSAQNAGAQVIYGGMAGTLDGGGGAGGHLFVIQAAGTATSASAWSDMTASPVTTNSVVSTFNPSGYDISSIAVDPHDATGRTVYVTVMGFGVAHLYRSIDAGAHWTNITRNLPNAPANSVVVDPNDANTVYVALDTGVYVTTQVTTCETANCWSVYGSGLPNAPVTQLIASASMPTGDGRTGELRAATYGRGVWQIPLLTAATPAQPEISVSPTSLIFASQAVATASAPQSVTVTNTGSAPLIISQVAISQTQMPLGPQSEFAETDDCIGSAVAVSQRCTVQVRFIPVATGGRSATMTIFGNVAGGQATVALSGTATAAGTVVLTPVTTNFPTTMVNATSAAQNITISNTGGAPVNLGTPAATGDFNISANTCTATLPANTGCTVAIVFAPTASGSRTGSFTITSSSDTLTASLSGNGVLPATDALAPASLAFAPQQLATSSAAQHVTLTNTGDVALTLIAAQIASGDFVAVNSCGNSLAAHSSCSVGVIFQPKSIGSVSGALTVSDQYRSQTVALSGTGVAPPGVSLSPLFGMSFPATGVGLDSAPQTVTLTNNGGLPLSIATVAISGDFTIVPGSNTCGATLAVGDACTMQIVFRPTAGGARSGSLTISDTAPTSPQTLSLTGQGVDFTLATNGPSSLTTTSGQNAVFPLLFTSGPAVAGTPVSLACSGAPANSTCKVSPSSVAVDGNATTVSVTVSTGVSGSASVSSTHGRILWATFFVPFGVLALRRRRLAAVAIVCVLLVAGGCGSGRLIPSPGGPGGGSGAVTPTGSYNIVVTATASGLTKTVNLTLVVQ
jgi:hypothetical protein